MKSERFSPNVENRVKNWTTRSIPLTDTTAFVSGPLLLIILSSYTHIGVELLDKMLRAFPNSTLQATAFVSVLIITFIIFAFQIFNIFVSAFTLLFIMIGMYEDRTQCDFPEKEYLLTINECEQGSGIKLPLVDTFWWMLLGIFVSPVILAKAAADLAEKLLKLIWINPQEGLLETTGDLYLKLKLIWEDARLDTNRIYPLAGLLGGVLVSAYLWQESISDSILLMILIPVIGGIIGGLTEVIAILVIIFVDWLYQEEKYEPD